MKPNEQRVELELELEQAEAIMKEKHHNSAEHKEAKSNAETIKKLLEELPAEVAVENNTGEDADVKINDDEQISDANEEADAIVAGAKAEAERIVSDAEEKAKSIKLDMEDLVEKMIGKANEEVKNIRELKPHKAGSTEPISDDDEDEEKDEPIKQASLGDCVAMERKQRQKAIDEKVEAESK